MCWVGWNRLTYPKYLGGLGIRDIQAFYTALLAKQAWWTVTNPDCLLARVVREKYCKNAPLLQVYISFQDIFSYLERYHSGPGSFVVKSEQSYRGRRQDGDNTNMWKELWLSTTHTCTPFGPAIEEDSDLYVFDLLCRGTNEWNVQRIVKVLPLLTHDILKIKRSLLSAKDICLASKSGSYTSKLGYFVATSVYYAADTATTSVIGQDGYKSVWISPKLKLFLWKVVLGGLSLGENLAKWGLINNSNVFSVGNLKQRVIYFYIVPIQDKYGTQHWWNMTLIHRPSHFLMKHSRPKGTPPAYRL